MIEEQIKAELNLELDKLGQKRNNTKGLLGLKKYAEDLQRYHGQFLDDLYAKYSNGIELERFKEIFVEVTNSRNSEIKIE